MNAETSRSSDTMATKPRSHEEIAAPVIGQAQQLTAEQYGCETIAAASSDFYAAAACFALQPSMSVAGASSCLAVFVAKFFCLCPEP